MGLVRPSLVVLVRPSGAQQRLDGEHEHLEPVLVLQRRGDLAALDGVEGDDERIATAARAGTCGGPG